MNSATGPTAIMWLWMRATWFLSTVTRYIMHKSPLIERILIRMSQQGPGLIGQPLKGEILVGWLSLNLDLPNSIVAI
jgi:hypothetical protein